MVGQNPKIAGHLIRIGALRATVAGVAPPGSWRLSGRADLWLFEPESTLPRDGLGFVVAHLKPSAEHAHFDERWPMSVPMPDRQTANFLCISSPNAPADPIASSSSPSFWPASRSPQPPPFP